MKRFAAPIGLILVLTACGGGGGGGGGALPAAPSAPGGGASNGVALPEPPEVTAKNGVATVSLTARIDAATAMPMFVYRGQRGIMPTIRVKPGDSIVVDVANDLPAGGGMQSDVNLHFHGLTVSPKPPADDVVTTLALPGKTLHYVVPIPKNQEPGLYWYHPHVFPVTDVQVGQAGMSGAIVVDGIERHLPALGKMTERLMIVRDVATSVAEAQTLRVHPHDEDQNNDPCGPDPGLQPTVNGAVSPFITIGRGEQQFFRVVNATGHKNLKLALDGGTLQVVAIDGFALDVYPGTPATETVSSIVVPPAGRAEFVVTGTGTNAAFRTLCYNAGPGGDPDPPSVLATLQPPNGAQRTNGTETARAQPLRAVATLPRNAFSQAMPHATVQRTIVLDEDATGMYINGKMFNMNDPPMFTVHIGTIEQWQVVNITQEVHDFHMHQTHFLVVQINGATVPHPHWSDSVVVPNRIPGKNGSWKPGYLTVLIDFRDPVIAGEFMFHCHILDHEDAGMMAKIKAI